MCLCGRLPPGQLLSINVMGTNYTYIATNSKANQSSRPNSLEVSHIPSKKSRPKTVSGEEWLGSTRTKPKHLSFFFVLKSENNNNNDQTTWTKYRKIQISEWPSHPRSGQRRHQNTAMAHKMHAPRVCGYVKPTKSISSSITSTI